MLKTLALTERDDHRRRMADLVVLLDRLRAGRSAASILAQINETSLQEEEERLSKDWLDGLFRGRKSVDQWELRALARGLVPALIDQREEARRRREIFRELDAIAFPHDWDGSDVV